MTKDSNYKKPSKNYSYEKPSFNDPKHEQASLDKPSFVFDEPSSPPEVKPKK